MPSSSDSQQMTALLRLRELLLRGEFTPGERMAEIPIAERLGVSRTPLRLALTALEHEGLLELHPTRGFVVRAFSRADIQDAIEIRGLLEGLAGRMIVQRLPSDAAGIAAMLEPLKASLLQVGPVVAEVEDDSEESFQQYIESNTVFHAKLFELAGSEVLTREMGRIGHMPFAAASGGFVRAHAEMMESRKILRTGQEQHQAIVEALEERDATRAETLLREHSRLARRNLDVVLSNRSASRHVPGAQLIRPERPQHISSVKKLRPTKLHTILQ